MTSALAPPLASIRTSAARPHTSRNRPIRLPLFELCGNLFGMLLVTLEDFQAGGEQVFEFRIAGRRNQRVLQSAVDGLMVGHLVADIGLVEGSAVKLRQFAALVGSLFAQRFAGIIVFRSDVELLASASALSLTALWSRTISSAKARTSLF